VKLGKTEEARKLLELIIKDKRNNISAWQWYAETWSKPKDKIRVWELCLRHNPANLQAQQALALIRNDPPQNLKTELVNPLDDNKAKSFPWLLWGSIGLLIIAAGLGIYFLKGLQPKDPAKYHHTQPVDYYLYVPKAYKADREWSLFVGIHGAGGTGLDCWNMWQSYADKEGFILLCPSIPGDASGFYQDVGEQTVWSAIGAVQKEYHVKRRMFFNGFSAGAYFIQGFTVHYPQYVSGLSILSAGVYLNPNMFPELVPVLVVIGSSDDQMAVATSRMFVQDLQKYRFDVQYEVMPGVGHTVTRKALNMTIDLFRKTIGK
jgi:pimeloyl-ACP methyl ester carboxylesterase